MEMTRERKVIIQSPKHSEIIIIDKMLKALDLNYLYNFESNTYTIYLENKTLE